MGLDRVVIPLINSSDMSATLAAVTVPCSPTKPWVRPPAGNTTHTFMEEGPFGRRRDFNRVVVNNLL